MTRDDQKTNQTIYDPRLRFRGHNQRQRQSKVDAPEAQAQAQSEIGYELALRFVDAAEPDPRLPRLARHYRTTAGVLLTSLDELVRAIVAGELAGA